MMPATFSVKNFEKFQHYKDRNPPWIRLYNSVLDDYEFGRLPDASKAHLLAIWLLASRYDNKIPYDPEWVSRRINATTTVDLDVLQKGGFISLNQTCSETLAERKQVDAPETEKSRDREDTSSLRSDVTREAAKPPLAEPDRKTGPELPVILRRHAADDLQAEFDREFWPGWPHKVGKPAALKAFRTARKRHELAAIIAGRDRYVRDKPPAREWLNPATFLNQERYNDQPASTEPSPANGRSRDPHEPLFRAIAEQFAAPDGVGVRSPGDDGIDGDHAGRTAEDRSRNLDLAASDYRRTGRP